MNPIDQIKRYTVVVADTGNCRQLAQFAPRLADTVARHHPLPLPQGVDEVLVRFGPEVLKLVPGRVSTGLDARLSFDVESSIAPAFAVDAGKLDLSLEAARA